MTPGLVQADQVLLAKMARARTRHWLLRRMRKRGTFPISGMMMMMRLGIPTADRASPGLRRRNRRSSTQQPGRRPRYAHPLTNPASAAYQLATDTIPPSPVENLGVIEGRLRKTSPLHPLRPSYRRGDDARLVLRQFPETGCAASGSKPARPGPEQASRDSEPPPSSSSSVSPKLADELFPRRGRPDLDTGRPLRLLRHADSSPAIQQQQRRDPPLQSRCEHAAVTLEIPIQIPNNQPQPRHQEEEREASSREESKKEDHNPRDPSRPQPEALRIHHHQPAAPAALRDRQS